MWISYRYVKELIVRHICHPSRDQVRYDLPLAIKLQHLPSSHECRHGTAASVGFVKASSRHAES